jgi:hypothetical protein
MTKEFVVTGQLREKNDNQNLILHGAFEVTSRDEAVQEFHNHFEPDFEIVKIYSVVDENGNLV